MVTDLPEPLTDLEYRDEIKNYFSEGIIPGKKFEVVKVNLGYRLVEYY